MRRAARIDANHREIVDALERAGACVTSLAAVGGGVADLLVSHAGKWWVIECKDGQKPPSRRQLTPDQQAWHSRQRARVWVVNSAEEAIQVLSIRP